MTIIPHGCQPSASASGSFSSQKYFQWPAAVTALTQASNGLHRSRVAWAKLLLLGKQPAPCTSPTLPIGKWEPRTWAFKVCLEYRSRSRLPKRLGLAPRNLAAGLSFCSKSQLSGALILFAEDPVVRSTRSGFAK